MKDKLLTTDAYKQLEVERIEDALEARREIWYNREVYDSVIEYLVMPLAELDALTPPADGPIQPGPAPITVFINSPGGSVCDGSIGFDAIVAAKSRVRTVALGMAASSAFFIFMAGDERLVYPNTTLMMHSFSALTMGSLPDIADDVEQMVVLTERWAGELRARTNMSTDQWLDIMGKDGDNRTRYFTAEQAKELGIAHGIVGE